MRRIGSYEAKTHLPRLLDEVARGERITITKHGVPVALLIPARAEHALPIGDAVAEIRAFRSAHRLDGLSVRELIEEGRR